jgi:adenylate cyclase
VKRLTLSGFFALATVAVALVVAAAMVLLMARSRRTILEESDKLQTAASQRIETEVASELARAQRALDDLARGLTTGVLPVDDPAALEASMLVRLLADSHLEEVTFTRARLRDYGPNGEAVLEPGGRFQITAGRAPDDTLSTRLVTEIEGGRFTAAMRQHPLAGVFPGAELVPAGEPGAAPDPTQELTFSVIASHALRGKAVWSDLHYAEADRALPPEQRRIVLTVQRAIFAQRRGPSAPPGAKVAGVLDEGELLGVVRCGLLTRDLDAIAQLRPDPASTDPQRVALVALTEQGPLRLVTRPSEADRLELIEGDLRVAPARLPPELAALLASPLTRQLAQQRAEDQTRIAGVVDVRGTPWRVSLAKLPPVTGGIAGWAVAVLVVEEHYTRALAATQRSVLIAFAITLAVLLLIGGMTLSWVRRDLSKIVATTERMRAFDFAPAPGAHSTFRDVDEAMAGLERAKTVVRAMGKYVPMDLVRQLYAENTEPALGGELLDVSILFTDIEGFTTLAETLPVDDLARHLGRYLEVMTEAIEATRGTIDKYIGDAVMAIWNAPGRVPNHASAACAAALACAEATEALYASPAWANLPPLVTRFGLHRARVLVGHFGAPTRLSYTALGDGVNLAARLEPLCKQYGVRMLVSEDIVAEAPAFRFRRLDRVAVKGKQHGIEIYELLGTLAVRPPDTLHATYEAAFTAYQARDFGSAIALLDPQASIDPPSAVLAARCRALETSPPPPDWDGVYVARTK